MFNNLLRCPLNCQTPKTRRRGVLRSFSPFNSMVAESDALVLLPHSLAASALAAGRVCILDVSRRESIRSMGMPWLQDSESLAVSVLRMDAAAHA